MKLILNDGTELENSSLAEDGNMLWLYVYANITLAELFELLNDPEKTKKIVSIFADKRKTHKGFKELFCIRNENGGFISAGLRK